MVPMKIVKSLFVTTTTTFAEMSAIMKRLVYDQNGSREYLALK